MIYTSYRTTKQKLLRSVQPFGSAEFARKINPIIAEGRGISIEDAKALMFLQSDEVVRFLHEIGEPLEGRGKKMVFTVTRLSKKDLRRMVPTISQPQFNKLLARIVSDNRDLAQRTAKYKRYLQTREVMQFLREIGELLPQLDTVAPGQKKEPQIMELV